MKINDNFSGFKNTVEFYFIRHGQSEGNAMKIMQGRGEYHLSDQGRREAAARGQSLKAELSDTRPEKILFFTSPLIRARETAQIISEEIGIRETKFPEPAPMDDLMEMDLGIWTEKIMDQVKEQDPSLWKDFQARSWDAIPGAESSVQLYDRAVRVWGALGDAAARQAAEKVIVISHSGALQWIIKTSMDCHTWFPLFNLAGCGLCRFCAEYRPIEQTILPYWKEINLQVS